VPLPINTDVGSCPAMYKVTSWLIRSRSFKRFAVDLGVNQVRHQVVGGVGPLQLGLVGQVGAHLIEAGQALVALVVGQHRVDRPGDALGPVPKLGTVLGRHAEHLREDLDRQWVGEVLDQVEVDRYRCAPRAGAPDGAAALGEHVERCVHPLVHPSSERLDLARPKRRGHQPAGAGVVGVVHHHDGAARPGLLGQALQLDLGDRRRGGAVHRRGDGRIPEERHHVVVTGDHPAAQQLGVLHRVVVAQRRIQLVGRLGERGIERVELRRRRCAHQAPALMSSVR
jgi:hypothetical protein